MNTTIKRLSGENETKTVAAQLLDLQVVVNGDSVELEAEWGSQAGPYEMAFIASWRVVSTTT